MNREQLVERIMQTRQEINCAGPVHRRDLQKHLKRLLALLRQYDRFQANARRKVG